MGAVEFGRFRLLPHRRELRADGVAVELGSRAFDILMVLIEARGALVSKDEFLSRVWPDTLVEENNLVVQISAAPLGTAAAVDAAAILAAKQHKQTDFQPSPKTRVRIAMAEEGALWRSRPSCGSSRASARPLCT